MKQKKLSIIVQDLNGETVFQKDPATPEHLMSCLTLFNDHGTKITIDVIDFEISVPNPNNG